MPKWSQHFLIDPGVAHDILDHAHLSREDVVLEIGPGRGVLTELLLPRVRFLLAIEIDPHWSEILRRRWPAATNFRVLTADFLAVDLESLNTSIMQRMQLRPQWKVIGNLPYAVTGPILQRLFSWPAWSEAILMVQREVAERVTSPPGHRRYGFLTVATQLHATPALVSVVFPSAFQPPPQVDSAILRLSRHPPLAPPRVAERVLDLARGAFQQRRKTLVNALCRAAGLPKPELLRALERLRLSPHSRPEALSVEDFLRLAKTLSARRKNASRHA